MCCVQVQPDFILDVEVGELNINAGLQDRVVQVYQGLVYMDFSRDIMDSRGHGEYRWDSCCTAYFKRVLISFDLDILGQYETGRGKYGRELELKGIVSVILSKPPCKDCNARFQRYP